MSPVSRGRKSAKSRRSGERVLRVVPDVPDECDCPTCSGAQFDEESLIDDLVGTAAGLPAVEDPLDAELFGASLVAAGELAGEGFTEALSEGLVRASTPESLAALLAVDAVAGGAAADAARLLTTSGVAAPTWADAMTEPVRVTMCRRFGDPAGQASILLCSFDRSGRSHAFIIHVDHTDCDAAADIVLVPGDMLDQVIGMIYEDARRAGVTLVGEDLDPAEFRWQAERALDARAVHDQETDEPGWGVGTDEDGPGYPVLAVLLRARMAILPEPPRPPAPHGERPAVEMLARAEPIQIGGPERKLPAKRKKASGPAPIYQIKVGLRGAKPPIWRRLELPGDTSLAELHRVIQVAFGWTDSHLHVFETPYGDFGIADPELGHRAEKPVTLEQVAPGAGDKLVYVYDFGDDWTHDILVEKLLDRQAVPYPRCTAGRRAAPPDDCGGIWGYAALVDILEDPGHPEHEERLRWLGLESAAGFQPAQFDAAMVTRMLTGRK